jgi:hypothetical protein
MLHYFAVTLHAVIYMLVSIAWDAVTNIVTSVTAFPLQFYTVQYTNIVEAAQVQLEVYINWLVTSDQTLLIW